MRRSFILFIALFINYLTLAQETETKSYFPDTNSFAITINADPLIRFAGNFVRIFSDSEFDALPYFSVSSTFRQKMSENENFVFTLLVKGRYTKSYMRTSFTYNQTTYDSALSSTIAYGEIFNITGGIGLEKLYKRGNRFQLYTGWKWTVGYTHGPRIENIFQTPMTANNAVIYLVDFSYSSSYIISTLVEYHPYRLKLLQQGDVVSTGLNIYLGGEYFIVPKISLGTQIGGILSFYYKFSGKRIYEVFDYNTETSYEFVEEIPSQFGLQFIYDFTSSLFVRVYF